MGLIAGNERLKSMKHYLLSHKIVLILVLAAIVRLSVFVAFPKVFVFEQTGSIQGSEAYDTYAQNLLRTGTFGRIPGIPDAAIPPLYSYLLAGVYTLIGRGALQVSLLHIVLDSISIVLLYELGKRLLPKGEAAGLLAGLFYALYPYLIFQNLTVNDTPLFIMLLYAFMLLMVMLRERPTLDRRTWALSVLGGLVLGLSMLVRTLLPPLAVLVAIWFLFRLNFRQTLLRLLPVAVIGVLIMLPWTIRNYGVYQRVIAVSLNYGDNLYQGNSRYTIPFLCAGYDVQWSPIDPLQAADKYSPEAADERAARGIQFLRENPDKIPELLWVKFMVYWSIEIAPRYNPKPNERLGLDDAGNFIIRQVDANGQLLTQGANDPVTLYETPLFDQLGRFVHRLYWGGLFLLGLVGIALTIRQWREVSLLWFAQISMTAVYVFFHPSTRYRAPTDPLWFLFSAYAILWVWEWWRARHTRTIAAEVVSV